MKSHTISPRSAIAKVKTILQIFSDDKVKVYAAQASFFIIISAIPFVMLLISLSRYVLPIEITDMLTAAETIIPPAFDGYMTSIADEIFTRPALPLASATAIMTLWSASRGVNAVGSGIRNVYGRQPRSNFVFDIMRSIVYTAAFILILVISLVVLVFGREISAVVSARFKPLAVVFDVIIKSRSIIFLAVLTVFFALVYSTMINFGLHRKNRVTRFRDQIPGAFVAALGWVLYSFFYSLYLRNFPSASYIYGSLAAIVLLMLWLYFCMIILLVGAEVNKYLIKRKSAAS
jgi:Predicted membrane protein